MGTFEWVVMGVTYAVMIALSITTAVFEMRKYKRDYSKAEREIYRVRTRKWIAVFFAVLDFVVLIGGSATLIYCSIMIEPAPKAAYAAIVFLMAFIVLIGVVMILFQGTNGVVVCEDGVWVFRLFLKTKFFRYDEIDSVLDRSELGTMGGGYFFFGKGHKQIFSLMYLRDRGVNEAYAFIQKYKTLSAEDIFKF